MIKRFRLSQFEAMAQGFIEGSLSRLLGGELEPLEVAARLAQAMEDNQQDGWAPDVYTVTVNPTDYEKLRQKSAELETELADSVIALSQHANLRLKERPEIRLTADHALKSRQVRVQAAFRETAGSTTQISLKADDVLAAEQEMLAELAALDAYLIVDGERHVALARPFFSIGRRTDNDLVLDAATVSRRHAQLRWRYGRFVLYDLSGRPGRTLANGQPVTEYALQSGDVITLANVKLIYGEGDDDPQRRKAQGFDHEETLPKPKASES